MKKLFSIDVWIGLVLMLFSIWFWALSGSFPDAAKLFPRIFLAANFILSAILAGTTLYRNSKDPERGQTKGVEKSDVLLILEAYVFIAVYFICIKLIGFYVSTTVFLLAFMYFLRVRSVKTLVLVTIGMDLFLYLLFGVGLKLNLPAGLLF